MPPFLLRLLGIDPARVPADAETAFHFTHAPRSWLVFVFILVAAGLIAAAVWLYRRDAATLRPRLRVALTALRCAVLAALLAILLGPALSVTRYQVVEPALPLLIDGSLSMGVRDLYQDDARRAKAAALVPTAADAPPPTRAELADALLAGKDGLLGPLAAKGRLVPAVIADLPRPLALTPPIDASAPGAAPTLPTTVPAGQSTNLARALRDALAAAAGRPLAGVVLLSDGQATAGESPLAVAEQAARQGAPVFAIGLGEAREPRNWRVAEAWAPERVHKADPFQIQARIETSGVAAGSVRVELVERGASDSGDGTVVATRQVPLPAGGGEAQVAFEHKAAVAGERVYSVRVVPEEREQLTADNSKAVAVQVIDQAARVLLVAGGPLWEYRLVKTLLIRDKTIDVSCWLQSMDATMRQEGDTVIERLPATAEQLFAYDCVLFLDPDPAAFDEAWIALLKRYLGEHGGGLLWMAGPKYTPQFFRRAATLGIADLLPIEIDQGGAFSADAARLAYNQQWPLRLTPDAADHPMFRLLSDPVANRRLCESLPGVFWSFPVRAAKPAARVLIEHSDPRLRSSAGSRPLLVVGQYGPGRTCFMGFEGSWRWRRVGEGVFDQWWIQAVRHLMEGRVLGGRSRGRLASDRDVYALGDRIAITAKLFDPAFAPLTRPALTARLSGPGGKSSPVELTAVADQPGAYQAAAVAADLGLNRLEVELPGDAGGPPIKLAKHLTVEVPRVEFADTRLDRALLSDLCARTGGRYFEIEEAHLLPAALPDRRETVVIPGRPIELWDTGRMLLLIVALLSLEWAIRRWNRLL